VEIFVLFLFFFSVVISAVFLGLFNDLIGHYAKVYKVRRKWEKDRG
jgi:hypothetical protein